MALLMLRGDLFLKDDMSHLADNVQPCKGCGALVPKIDAPTHPYIGASPGCWAIYGEMLAKGYAEEHGNASVRHLTVDAYAAQHPGVPERRSIQSVAVHLITLYLVLERGHDPERATEVRRKALALIRRQEFVWLDPPALLGAITVLDVWAAKDPAERTEIVERWVRSVWEAWAPHHETVRCWAGW